MTAAMKLKDACSLKEKLRYINSVLKSKDITLLTKVHIVNTTEQLNSNIIVNKHIK